ncbi:MAG: PilZ domain-containing protein [Bdellovibrionales bacterium]
MSSKDQRRYPRVRLQADIAESIGELSASLTWPNLEASSLTDLSYRGCAAQKPGLFPFAAQQVVPVHVRLGISPSFACKARVVWFNLEQVGLEFLEIPPEGHYAIGEFLDAKLIGQALRPVQASWVDKGEAFDRWLQGPNGISVFIYMKTPLMIDQVHLELAEGSVHFSRGTRVFKPTPVQLRALLILSQMDKPDIPMKEFLRSIAPGV